MPTFGNLYKILAHEQQKGCKNVSIIGGMENFLANWAKQNRGSDPSQNERIESIIDRLKGYDQATPEARQTMLTGALELARDPVGTGRSHISRVQRPLRPDIQSRHGSHARPKRDSSSRDQRPGPAAIALAGPASTPEAPEGGLADEEEEGAAPQTDFSFGLDAPVVRLQGVGAMHARRLESLGVRTVEDLLYFFPRRYDDFRNLKTISQLMYGEEVTLKAKVSTVNSRVVRGNFHITNVLLVDQTGSINATFYRQPFLAKRLRPGTELVVSGRVDRDLNRLCFKHPEWEPLTKELLHTARIVPVYPLTEGLTARWLRKLERNVVEYWAGKLKDPLPKDLKANANLIDLETALREIHFPSDQNSLAQARRRLAFEEFLMIQIGVLRQRRKWRKEPGKALSVDPALVEKFISGLPYQLTGAQKRALNEILNDIQQTAPMSRLLQGDVGSGKTVVATAGMLVAVANGAQAVLMAPTEILAEQHFNTISQIVASLNGRLGIAPRVQLLLGSMRPREKADVHARIAAGQVDLAIGTHALIQEAVNFTNLAYAVIDEQHRFGVAQRAAIRQKGYNPHILVMSATPIPRTLALTVYGDLDLSVLDEMPPGRREIRTKWLEPQERERAYTFIRKQVNEGRQAFVICPLIEESEAIDARAAVEEYERLKKEVYSDLRVGLIHGKLRSAEKDGVMSAFRDHKIDVLVATSVVEVGIDVPNASVMLIEGADRFGMAQLHQFRGRVGRGEHQSYCMLLAEKSGSTSDDRLKVIEETQDGFRLAEQDLALRGPGEFFGTRQSGLPDLKVAKLSDVRLLEEARKVAQAIFESDPELKLPENVLLKANVLKFWHGEGDLS